MEQKLTNAKVINFPIQNEIAIPIPHKKFRSTYAERLAIPYQIKERSNVNWWNIINSILYPFGFIVLALEIFL